MDRMVEYFEDLGDEHEIPGYDVEYQVSPCKKVCPACPMRQNLVFPTQIFPRSLPLFRLHLRALAFITLSGGESRVEC